MIFSTVGREKNKRNHRKLLTISQMDAVAGYLFILPASTLFVVFMILPVIAAITLSFTKYDVFSPAEWIGLSNFAALFNDQRLLAIYINTFTFTIFAVIFNVGFGLVLALLMNRKMPSLISYTCRLGYFMPVIISMIYVAIVWQAFFTRDVGIINFYLQFFQIEPIGWLIDPDISLSTVIFVDVWKNTGFAMVVFLAGLQNIPRSYYEAAYIDGGSPWQIFRGITFPLLSPTIFFNVIIYSIGALQVFDSISILTGGGPGDSTRSVTMYIFETAFQGFNFGYASTLAFTLFLIIMGLTLLQFKLSDKWVNY